MKNNPPFLLLPIESENPVKRYFLLLLLTFIIFSMPLAPFAFDADADVSPFFDGFEGCFVLMNLQSGKTLQHNPTRCDKRMPPCSTFKVPHALIALELGVVKNPEDVMKWDGTPQPIKPWNRDHNFFSAMEFSVVWYFQRIAEQVGWEQERNYVTAFDYGNQTVDGNLTTFWLDKGPLEITANEQIAFLKKFHYGKLPVSKQHIDTVKKAMVFKESDEYILRGKTGSGRLDQGGGWGWYVGVLERGGDAYLFATNIEGKDAMGSTARETTIKILNQLRLIED